MALTRDNKHDEIRGQIQEIAKKCKSASDFIKELKAQNIEFKESLLAGGKSISIPTGYPGYDIIGVEVVYQKNQYVIRDIMR